MIRILRLGLIDAFCRFNRVPIQITAFFRFLIHGNCAGYDADVLIVNIVNINIDLIFSGFFGGIGLHKESFVVKIILDRQSVRLFFRNNFRLNKLFRLHLVGYHGFRKAYVVIFFVISCRRNR